eukprot:143408_1
MCLGLGGIGQGDQLGLEGGVSSVGQTNQEVGEDEGRGGSAEGVGGDGGTSGEVGHGVGGGTHGDGGPLGAVGVDDVLDKGLAGRAHAGGLGVGGQVEEAGTGAGGRGDVGGGDGLHVGGLDRGPQVLDGDNQGARGQDDAGAEQGLVTALQGDGAGDVGGEDLDPLGELTEAVVVPCVGDAALADGGSDLVVAGHGVGEADVGLVVRGQRGAEGGDRDRGGGRGGRGSVGGVVGLAHGDLEGLGGEGGVHNGEVHVTEGTVGLAQGPTREALTGALTRGRHHGASHDLVAVADGLRGHRAALLGGMPLPRLVLGALLGQVELISEGDASVGVGAAAVLGDGELSVVVVTPVVEPLLVSEAREDVSHGGALSRGVLHHVGVRGGEQGAWVRGVDVAAGLDPSHAGVVNGGFGADAGGESAHSEGNDERSHSFNKVQKL